MINEFLNIMSVQTFIEFFFWMFVYIYSYGINNEVMIGT